MNYINITPKQTYVLYLEITDMKWNVDIIAISLFLEQQLRNQWQYSGNKIVHSCRYGDD